WSELFKKYINHNDEPIQVSESIAPYYYFQGNAQLQGLGFGTSVLIDIGGGTSDVVVYENNKPKLISSYKFAGNALFGNGYTKVDNMQGNPLINKFRSEYDDLLQAKSPTLKAIFDSLYSTQNASDYNTFLFSLS